MNARFAPMTSSNLVLRVLTGRQAGAEYRLQPGLTATIGHSFQHDIVLRSSGTKGLSLSLALSENVAQLSVKQGSITLLGRPVAAGEAVTLPPFMPVDIAGLVFAIGDAESERWDEVLQIAETPAAPEYDEEAAQNTDAESEKQGPVPAVKNAASEAIKPVENAVGHLATQAQTLGDKWQLPRRWPFLAALFAIALIIAVAVGPASQYFNEQTAGVAATEQKLARVGFGDVDVSRNAAGKIILSGVLAKDADLQRLREFSSKRLDNPEIAVKTMEGLAASATALLNGQSVDAEARPGRGRSLIIESQYLPGDKQAELEQMIRDDIPEIATISFQPVNNRGDQDLQYFFSGGNFGLATYVDGDPAYIRTADGTTWFKGAEVPTGHTIIAISGGIIRFERNGSIEELGLGSETSAQTDGENAETKNEETTISTQEGRKSI